MNAFSSKRDSQTARHTFLKKEKILIILIVAAGAFLRFWRIGSLTTFSGDQGYDFLIIKRMLLDGSFTLLGPKIGPYNELGDVFLGPAYYYLLAPALLIFKFDPVGPALFTAFLAVLTIFILYKIGAKFFSKEVGLLASILYAANAFLIDQSRAPSNPHLIPFFSAMAILSALELISGSKRKIWPILIGLSFGIAFQLHYLAVSAIFITILMLLIYRPKSTFLLLVFFFLALSPQIVFELRHSFFITNQIIKQLTQGETITSISLYLKNIESLLRMIPQMILQNSFLSLLSILSAFVFLGVYYLQNKSKRKNSQLLFLMVISGILLAALYSKQLHLHYLTIIYIPIFILAALVIHQIYRLSSNFLYKTIIIIIFFAQIISANLLSLNLNRVEGYTMPQGWNLQGVKKASKIIASDSLDKKFNIASTLDGDTRARPYRYLVEVYGQKPQDVEAYPNSEIIYLIARGNEETIKTYTVWEVSSFMPFKIEKSWDIQNGIKLYKLTK